MIFCSGIYIFIQNHKFSLIASLLILVSGITTSRSQGLRINEVMSSNGHSFYDEDNDTPDWIELYNDGPAAVDLSGYGLSDNIAKPLKWTFPGFVLDTGTFLLIAASGKNRKSIPVIWETIITANDTFRYLVPGSDPGSWRNPGFDDTSWSTGRSGFGYGDLDDSSIVPDGTITVMARKSFEVSNLSSVKKMLLHVDFDDAFVSYLNGHEIARAQIGVYGAPPAWNAFADNGNHEATMYQGGMPDAFPLDSVIKYLVEGSNIFAIEVHNSATTSSDMSCTPFLTLGYSERPILTRGTAPFINLSDSYFHTNFTISSAGDTLILSDSNGILIDSLSTGELPKDISLGLKPDGILSRWLFAIPTPGSPNMTEAFPVFTITDPVFSNEGGYFKDSIDLIISGSDPGDSIWYSTDGSDPVRGDSLYTGSIRLKKSTVIRATILGPGRIPLRSVIHNYLFREEAPTLTTISLSTDPANFFDWNSGIYVLGPNASPDAPNFGANFWQDWERPVHIELFEKDGSIGMQADAGVRIFGGWSRANPQRSMAFYARSIYGSDAFRYKLFPDLTITEYQCFILRNAGNDWNNSMFRDGLMSNLLDYSDLDRMAYRPASIYLNGVYWGLLNIREKINEHFLAEHHGIDPFQVDLLEYNGNPLNGDAEHYNEMINFLTQNSPSEKENYRKLKTMMNVENFMEYEIANIYINNTDWPGNNIKFWRPRTPEGKWRWIVFDADFGFGIWTDDIFKYTHNTLAFALEPNGPEWPNPPWSTFLLRRLIENQEFRNEFINRFADRLNTAFDYHHVLQRINEMQETIATEIPYHLARWNQWGEDINSWNYNVETMRVFAQNRVNYMRRFISQQFYNIGYYSLNADISPSQGGTIQLNTLNLGSFPWSGIYFEDIPVKLIARPNPGFRFVKWQGPVSDPFVPGTTITISGETGITAVFETDGSGISEIVINEIYYKDPPGFNADDWVELYNKGVSTIDLSGWILKDQDDTHKFIIPQGTVIYPKEYIVLSRNTSKFKSAFPDKKPPVGDFSFGLGSSGDCIRLFTADSSLVDSVWYGINYPWPTPPNGSGTSLELIDPGFDNSLAINWNSSTVVHGTPGEINSLATGLERNYSGITSVYKHFLINYPNPFTAITSIRYEIRKREKAKLSVFDLQGQLVNTLFDGETDPGVKEITWDGCRSDGSKLTSGIYICLLQTKSSTNSCRLVLIR